MKLLLTVMIGVAGMLVAISMVAAVITDGHAAPKEGSSCAGIGPMEGKVACDGKKVIACSSYTKYKYILTQTCSAKQKCIAAADGKSASCK